jgi:hypothetical protein
MVLVRAIWWCALDLVVALSVYFGALALVFSGLWVPALLRRLRND